MKKKANNNLNVKLNLNFHIVELNKTTKFLNLIFDFNLKLKNYI